MTKSRGIAHRPLVMDVRLRSIQQLFSSLDPSPFVVRDLDEDAEAFIVSWARELPGKGEFRLVIHLEEFSDDPSTEMRVGEAVRNYFRYRTEAASREFRQLLREGRLSLAIGLLFLAGCLLFARYLTGLWEDNALAEFAGESLIIGGWVAMWRPLEIFLYAWWPLARRRGVLNRLARMDVKLVRHA